MSVFKKSQDVKMSFHFQEVRKICTEFSEEHGLPNYPVGVVFTFWEQYIWLREHLLRAIVIILAASFLVIALVLWNVWAAIIIVSMT